MDHSPRTRRKRFNEYWKRREAARRAGEPIPSVFDEFLNLFESTTKNNTNRVLMIGKNLKRRCSRFLNDQTIRRR